MSRKRKDRDIMPVDTGEAITSLDELRGFIGHIVYIEQVPLRIYAVTKKDVVLRRVRPWELASLEQPVNIDEPATSEGKV